jgi:hypothetical protein
MCGFDPGAPIAPPASVARAATAHDTHTDGHGTVGGANGGMFTVRQAAALKIARRAVRL